jgi:hypothetical protein
MDRGSRRPGVLRGAGLQVAAALHAPTLYAVGGRGHVEIYAPKDMSDNEALEQLVARYGPPVAEKPQGRRKGNGPGLKLP